MQSPMATVTPTAIDLGRVYIGIPVKFSTTIENTSNLQSKYKLERPGGDSTSFKLSFDVFTDTLKSKSKAVVTGEFPALSSGILDEIIACKIFGSAQLLLEASP